MQRLCLLGRSIWPGHANPLMSSELVVDVLCVRMYLCVVVKIKRQLIISEEWVRVFF